MPIPFGSIDRYAARYGVDAIDDFDRMLDVIGQMDGAYLKWVEAKRPSEKLP